uniref:hypothetical protein n=1 Tax=Flavobacterium sp. TaxID=239 RepID=UPI0025F81D32
FTIIPATSSNVLRIKIPYIHHQIDSTPSNPDDSVYTYQDEYYHIKIDSVRLYSSSGNVYASCKSNRSYETGIVYLDDDGRYSTVLSSKDNTAFIPIKNSINSNSLQLEIKHKPPYWANRYKIFVKDSKLSYQTIYGVIAYQEGSFLWIKLEGQDKQKVQEGDYLIVKKNINGPSEEVIKLQVLEYAVKPKDFISGNKNQLNEDLIEAAGVYIKVKSSGALNIDGIEKNFYEFNKESANMGDYFFVFAGGANGFSKNIGTYTMPISEDIAITPGSRITIDISNTKGGNSGNNVQFKKDYIVSDSYDNFQSWFETEGDGLGDFKTYEFVRGFTKNESSSGGGLFGIGGLEEYGEVITLDPNGFLYLKIKNQLNGNGQNRSFLYAKITITTGFSVLILETDPKDNHSEVFYETQDTYLINNGYHLGKINSDTSQSLTSNSAIINLDWFNCFTQGNGAESYIVKDVFNKNFLSTNSRPNAVQLDGYKERRNIASLTYSGAFDKTTNYNSLNEFNLSRANYKDLDDKYGSIQKIHSRDTDLIILQEDKVHKVLYNKNILTDAIGGGQISSIEEVLGQEVPFSGEWGISINPESFSYYANSLYFTDTTKGVVLRLGGDGLEPISRYKMRDWFSDNLRTYKSNFKYGGYDPVHNNYILSLSDSKVSYENILVCNQKIQWLNIEPNSTYIYKINLGSNIGTHTIDYSLDSGDSADFDVNINGVTTTFSNRTGSGTLSISKPTSGSEGVLTIYNTSNTLVSLSLTNHCVTTPELEVITLVVNDDLDVSKSMTNKYYWSNSTLGKSGESSLLDVFLSSGISRFNSDFGNEGENEIPYNNSLIRVTSTKETGEFTSCNKIGYVITSSDLDAQQIIDTATYPTIINSGSDNYIEFNFTRTSGQKLYLIWDYIDVENCDVIATQIELCYNETDYLIACDCSSTSDYSNLDYSSDYFIDSLL